MSGEWTFCQWKVFVTHSDGLCSNACDNTNYLLVIIFGLFTYCKGSEVVRMCAIKWHGYFISYYFVASLPIIL